MKINWTRFFIGALVVAIIAFITDGLLHEKVLAGDWQAVYDNLRATPPEPHGSSMAYFAIFEIGRGLITMFVYVLLRHCCYPGPKTAAWAGVVAWVAYSVTGPAQFVPLNFLSTTLWFKMIGLQLITSIVAAIAGAAIYKDATTTQPVQ